MQYLGKQIKYVEQKTNAGGTRWFEAKQKITF